MQMEIELHTMRERLANVSSDRHKLEDRLSAVEAAHLLAQDQASQLQVGLVLNTWPNSFYTLIILYITLGVSFQL